jgi:hypothetical protein
MIEQVKRYHRSSLGLMEHNKDGEWVKYAEVSDVVTELEALRELDELANKSYRLHLQTKELTLWKAVCLLELVALAIVGTML